MTKPRKALRGLFSRTESEILQVEEVTPKELPRVELKSEEPLVEEFKIEVAKEIKEEIKEEFIGEISEGEILTVSAPLTTEFEQNSTLDIVIPEIPVVSFNSEDAQSTPHSESEEVSDNVSTNIVTQDAPRVAFARSLSLDEEDAREAVLLKNSLAVKVEKTPKAVVEKPMLAVPSSEPVLKTEDSLAQIQRQFELNRTERSNWHEEEYLECLKRIDRAQTEAFFLKGKLLDEVKRRFYEGAERAVGWKRFTEDALGMNYTTANQYIRVAQEFDVTSHPRKDFGFEHFKALLPLKDSEREELVSSLPSISVKALRDIVQKRLSSQSVHAPREVSFDVRELVKLLQDLKTRLHACEPETLPQAQGWQLSAACMNLSQELAAVAQEINSQGRKKRDGAVTGASQFKTDSLREMPDSE